MNNKPISKSVLWKNIKQQQAKGHFVDIKWKTSKVEMESALNRFIKQK